jgi:ubiquilin
MGGMPAMNP